jgi:hypothetical protein
MNFRNAHDGCVGILVRFKGSEYSTRLCFLQRELTLLSHFGREIEMFGQISCVIKMACAAHSAQAINIEFWLFW